MSEKITLQSLSDKFAETNGLTKKLADSFLKQFFEVVQEGLAADGVVKIKGFGTFKLVDVAERESVSVSTGERVVISGYKKVSFIPDEEINTMLTEKIGVDDEEESADEEEEEIMQEEEVKEDMTQEEVMGEEEIEKPGNEFAAIDMLISTPESIEEAKADLQKARETAANMQTMAEEALNAAREAHREVIRLEVLVQRLETNAAPEVKPLSADSEEKVCEKQDKGRVDNVADDAVAEADVNATAAVVSADNSAGIDETDSKSKSGKGGWAVALILLFVLLIGGGAYWWYVDGRFGNGDVSDVCEEISVSSPVGMTDTVKADTMRIDTLAQDTLKHDTLRLDTVKQDTVKQEVLSMDTVEKRKDVVAQSPDSAKLAGRPITYKMKSGDTLMKIARRFYGDASYVADIIRVNNFSDPDNVHIGTEIILP